MADKIGTFDRLGYGASSPATVEFHFLEGSTLGLNEQPPIDTNALRGTRSHTSERVRQGTRRVDGSLVFAPSPVELDTLLYLILGTAEAADLFALAETVPSFYLAADRNGTLYNYSSCKVNRATFEGSEGTPINLAVEVIGTDETITGSFASLSADVASQPYVFHDATLSVGGQAYNFRRFALTIDNALEVVYRNSATPTAIHATDRTVSVGLALPLGDASAAYASAVSSAVAVTLTFTNGARSILFSMPACHAPRAPIPFGIRGAIDFDWQGIARRTAASLELVTTSDSTG